jgi:carbon monoxide dehydrogenase subunit G
VRFEHTVSIDRPPRDVFAFLADVENLPRWQGTVTEASLDDDGRIRETRSFLGRRVVSTLEIAASEPPSRWDLRTIEGPVRFTVSHRLEASGDGTRLTVVGEGEAVGLGRLAGPLVGRAVQRQAAEDFARLKRLLERPPDG